MSAHRRVSAALARSAILLCCAACEPALDRENSGAAVCEPPAVSAPLPDAIQESSGVAASRAHPGVFWTHNDSGRGPIVFALDSTGTILASVRVEGATNRDWEDIDVAPCAPGGDQDCLFIGDIGDNEERHARVAVYMIPEPNPRTDSVSSPVTAIYATYRDGPRDAEALFVNDQGIHLINKGRNHSIQLFRIPPPYRSASTVSLTPLQQLAPPPTSISAQVTAAAGSAAGERVVVRTYGDLRFFRVEGDTLAPLGRPATLVAPDQRQGEGVDFRDDERLVLTSEVQGAQPASLVLIQCDPLRVRSDRD